MLSPLPQLSVRHPRPEHPHRSIERVQRKRLSERRSKSIFHALGVGETNVRPRGVWQRR